MEISKDYLKTAEKDVNDLTKIHKTYWDEPRYQILKKFCLGAKKILSVGCGPKEPTIIHASHACDITRLSYEYLKKLGWMGQFFISSCDKIGAMDKEFEIVVCSEVIEHLPDFEFVKKTFHEVARVGKRWIITTPNSAVIFPKNQNPSHKQFFTLESIKKIIPFPCKIYTNDHHIYMENLENE